MYNYPFYGIPSYYPTGSMSGGLLKGLGGGSLLKGMAGKWNWNSFLTSTGKTLNVINQAIPIFYQVRPILHNAKTFMRVLGAVNSSPNERTTTGASKENNNNNNNNNITTPSNYNEIASTPTNEVQEDSFTEEGNPIFFL